MEFLFKRKEKQEDSMSKSQHLRGRRYELCSAPHLKSEDSCERQHTRQSLSNTEVTPSFQTEESLNQHFQSSPNSIVAWNP